MAPTAKVGSNARVLDAEKRGGALASEAKRAPILAGGEEWNLEDPKWEYKGEDALGFYHHLGVSFIFCCAFVFYCVLGLTIIFRLATGGGGRYEALGEMRCWFG